VLRIELFRTRTFRVAVIGSFVTRLGAGGWPFLLPLLYQVGLGSRRAIWLLIMPQFLAAHQPEVTIPAVLTGSAYRRVLGINTLLMRLVIGSSP